MIQKTIITSDFHLLKTKINEWNNESEYARASSRVLLFSDQNDDPIHLRTQVGNIRSAFPDIEVIGITMPKKSMMQEFSDQVMAGYSLWATEEARIDIVHYDCRNIPVSEAGRTLAQEVEKREHVAGVLLFSAGMEREIDAFLIAMAGGDERCRFPVIGAQAAAASHPCICGSFVDGFLEEKGIVALILSGPNLQMFYNYEMGWRPIGKEMRVTETRGKYCISKINGMPAASIYWKYLGVEPDEYFAENVREFPFVVKRGDREVVRTPSGTDEEGNLQFIARIKPDESLHLSYGNPRRLMDEVHLFANSMARFKPQALLLIECENRIRFLGNMSEQDIVCYWSIMPQVFWVRGYTAIMMDRQGGGVVNSSILSVGFREGMRQNEDPDPVTLVSNLNKKGGAIPLDQRLAMFLEQTTHELAEMAVTAEAANTAKSAFLSQMSHEIRTPINAVIGMNEMILRESENPHVLQYAQDARVAGMNLLSIISDILDFSKIEAGKMELTAHEYVLASLINDLVNLIRLRAEEKALEFVVRVDPTTPHILLGDELLIKQIITNLLTNAVKYTEKGRIVWTIDYEPADTPDEVILKVAVRDTGIGIKKDNIGRLYNAFDRIDKERTRVIEGTGLGINITQKLLNLMDSRLEVESEFGKGSVFSFSLRQGVVSAAGIGDYSKALEAVTRQRVARRTEFTAKNARILVVDDAPMNLSVLTGLLKRTRMQVDTATSGRECIERFGLADYDMVFLDHRMPQMDGIETLRKMQQIYGKDLRGVPVISLTANAVSGAREEYLAAGFSDYLTKPVIVEDLEAMILKYLPETKVAEGEDEEEATLDKSLLPPWLLRVGLLHPDNGLAFCGGVNEYLEALYIFAASIDERAEEIDRAYSIEDWDTYTVKIHALKTMTRSVGADELSDLARGLEEAGEQLDINAIRSGHMVFTSLYRGLKDYLSPLLMESDKSRVTAGAPAADKASSVSEAPSAQEESRFTKEPEPLFQEESLFPEDSLFPEAEEIPNHRKSILLVDDDKDYLMLLARWLGRDYEVDTASSGAQALRYLKDHHPDLILLDFYMPGMDGPTSLQWIRENSDNADIPVVFLSGTEDRESVSRAERLNPQGFLPKTTGKAALLKGIASFLG